MYNIDISKQKIEETVIIRNFDEKLRYSQATVSLKTECSKVSKLLLVNRRQ